MWFILGGRGPGQGNRALKSIQIEGSQQNISARNREVSTHLH